MSEQTQAKGPFDFARSVSQRRTWLQCGRKALLQYGQGWQFPHERGIFKVGHTYQDVVNMVLRRQIQPAEAAGVFRQRWAAVGQQQPPLWWAEKARVGYKEIETRVPILLDKVAPELVETLRIGEHGYLDQPLNYEFAPGVKGTGRPDFYGEGCDMWRFLPEPLASSSEWKAWLSGWTPGILDFKTSSGKYNVLEAELDDQLTEYEVGQRLAKPELPRPRWLALHVGIYTASPDRQWLVVPARSEDEIAEHINMAITIDRMFKEQIFPRDVGQCFAMGECDMVPVCYSSQRHRIGTDIVQRTRRANITPVESELL